MFMRADKNWAQFKKIKYFRNHSYQKMIELKDVSGSKTL